MGKIVICGVKGAGKTCYLYGMLQKMMIGYHGFSISPQAEDYPKFRLGIKRLNDVTLPLEERFPAPNLDTYIYPLDLLYNFKCLETFDWIDYPGEMVEESDEKFISYLEDANALFICVDGAAIRGTSDDIDRIVETLTYEKGGMDLNNALRQSIKKNNGSLPPVCIMITKYDMVSEELRNMEIVNDIVKKTFPVLFHTGEGGIHRFATICPVTLGKNINQGAKLEPKNVEMPICFAAYLIQLCAYNAMMEEVNNLQLKYKNEVNEYNKTGFFRRIVTPKPKSPLTDEQKKAIIELMNSKEKDLEALKSAIEAMEFYLDGEKTNLD